MLQILLLHVEGKKFCKLITFTKKNKLKDLINIQLVLKPYVHKKLLKTLGTHLFWQYN